MLFVFICAYWGPTRFPYQMIFVLFISNTTGVTSEAGTTNPSGAPEFTPGFYSGVALSILSFLCRVLNNIVCPYVLFLLAFYHLFFFDLRLMPIPLVSLISFVRINNKQGLARSQDNDGDLTDMSSTRGLLCQ